MKATILSWICLVVYLVSAPVGQLGAVEISQSQADKISFVVGRILEQVHLKQQALNDEISNVFLEKYFDTLDHNHMFFLQLDIDEFREEYSDRLDELTEQGEAGPGFVIFEKYLERLAERNERVQELIQEDFDFTVEESFIPDRNKVPWPDTEKEANELWRLRIKYELLQTKLNEEPLDEARERISKRYNRLVKTMNEFENTDILQMYLSSLARAYDPHSDYMSPMEAENFKIATIDLSLSGIGARLTIKDGYTTIVELIPGGPAEMSKKLHPNDKIVAVAQGDDGEPVDVVEMRLQKVVEMIRGKRGTKVRLTILPADAPDGSSRKEITLVRDEIKLKEQRAKAMVYDHPVGDEDTIRLGVINLPQFYDGCAKDAKVLIERLKQENIKGLLLDLRRNGGGILDEAIDLAGLFIEEGPIVQVINHRRETTVMQDLDHTVAYQGPLTVLVDRLSASASEIVAAALQDYGRAVVVGDQATHGKGTVQSLLSLDNFIRKDAVPNPGNLKLTVSKFYRIEGGTTQKEGVQPDIVLPSIYDYMDIGESALDNPLPSDRTDPQEHEQFGQVAPYVGQLRSQSKERIQKSTDFGYVQEDIEILQKRKADKTVSLNEQKRIEESEKQKNRLKKREEERKNRKTRTDVVYELTLDMVEEKTPLKPIEDDPTALNEEELEGTEGENGAVEMNPPMDVHLQEGLNILSDYLHLLEESGNPIFTVKNAPAF